MVVVTGALYVSVLTGATAVVAVVVVFFTVAGPGLCLCCEGGAGELLRSIVADDSVLSNKRLKKT